MESQISLPHSQQPEKSPYSTTDQTIQCLLHHLTSRKSILILSHLLLGLPSGIFLSVLPTNLYTLLPVPYCYRVITQLQLINIIIIFIIIIIIIRATCSDNIASLDLITGILSYDGYRSVCSTKTKSMAMCGNHIQGAKIVINDNLIEQVTDFKYLGYLSSG
jgi:hypothetical protein